MLREVRPHVVLLQEMGPAPYLEELQRDLAAEGFALPERALVLAADSERHLALLARVPLRALVPHERVALRDRALAAVVRRGVLEARVAFDGAEITFFVVHLKSRHAEEADDPGSNKLRAAEAEAVRDLVLRTFPRPDAARFLIVGDCNDAPRSRPLRALQRRGDTEITRLWPALDRSGDAWTHLHRQSDEYARFDYVLVSPALGEDPAVRVQAAIFDSPAVRQASDHRPIVITLTTRAANAAVGTSPALPPSPPSLPLLPVSP